MNRLKSICRAIKFLAAVVLCFAATHGTALAQAAEEKEDGGGRGGAWVLSYALVLLGIGLGMLVVFRSSRRKDRSKPQQYGDE